MSKSRGWICLCSLVANAQLLDFLSNDTPCEWATRLSTSQRSQKSLPCTPMWGIKHSKTLRKWVRLSLPFNLCSISQEVGLCVCVFKASGPMIFQPHLAPICWFQLPFPESRTAILSLAFFTQWQVWTESGGVFSDRQSYWTICLTLTSTT